MNATSLQAYHFMKSNTEVIASVVEKIREMSVKERVKTLVDAGIIHEDGSLVEGYKTPSDGDGTENHEAAPVPAASPQKEASEHSGHVRQNYLNWFSTKAEANISKWGLQTFETLGLAVTEEAGELAKAILQFRDEWGPGKRISEEAGDLGALCLQVLALMEEQHGIEAVAKLGEGGLSEYLNDKQSAPLLTPNPETPFPPGQEKGLLRQLYDKICNEPYWTWSFEVFERECGPILSALLKPSVGQEEAKISQPKIIEDAIAEIRKLQSAGYKAGCLCFNEYYHGPEEFREHLRTFHGYNRYHTQERLLAQLERLAARRAPLK